MTYKYNAVDVPKCPGWWWCVPVTKCDWFREWPDGVVCEIVASDGCSNGKYYPEQEGLSVCFGGNNYFGFSDLKYSGEFVGKWYGPILPPNGEAA